MNDLLLWRALAAAEPLDDRLVPLLEELAVRDRSARRPFFARLIRAARDARPHVRAAALRALAGASGPDTFRAIVRGLDDVDRDVGFTAVQTLRISAADDPVRLVHALFHRDPAVRAACASGPLPRAADFMLLHLLGDEACARLVLDRISTLDTLPGEVVIGVVDMLATGRLSADLALDTMRRVKARDILITAIAADGFLPAGHIAALETLAREAHRPDPAPPGTGGRLAALVTLIAPGPHARSGDETRQACLGGIVEESSVSTPATRAAVAVAVVQHLLATGDDHVDLVRLLVAAWPAAVLWPWIDVGARRAAAGVLAAIPPERLEAHPPPGIDPATWLDAVDAAGLLRDDPGSPPDLGVVAAVGRLLGRDALERTIAAFPRAALVAALRDPRAAAFLGLPGDDHARLRLVMDVCGGAAERGAWPARLAPLVPWFNAPLLPVLAPLTPRETVRMLEVLQRLVPPPIIRDPRGGRMQRLAREIGRLLVGAAADAGDGHFVIDVGSGMAVPGTAPTTTALAAPLGAALPDFIRQWWQGPRGPVDALLRAILLAACDFLPAAELTAMLRRLPAGGLRFLLLQQFDDKDVAPPIRAAVESALESHEAAGGFTLAGSLVVAAGTAFNRIWAAVLGGGGAARGRDEAAAAARRSGDSPARSVYVLDGVERVRLANASNSEFPDVVIPWARRPNEGLAEALTRRYGPQRRGVEAAAAILLCRDVLPDVDAALAEFIPEEAGAIDRLDADLAADWTGSLPVTLQLHVWLARWERHAELALAMVLGSPEGSLAVLAGRAADMSCGPLAARFFAFIRGELDRCRFRDRGGFHAHATSELADALVAALAGRHGCHAADVLAPWAEADPSSAILTAANRRVAGMLPDLRDDVRRRLERWVSSRGLRPAPAATAGGGAGREAFEACLGRASPLDLAPAREALEVVVAETGPAWFAPRDWDRLRALGIPEREIARRLALSAQPHAYITAVEALLTDPHPDADDVAALAAFLERGDERLASLRLLAARMLRVAGDPVGLPLLLAAETEREPQTPELFAGLDAEAVVDAVQACLAAGGGDVRESVLCDLLLATGVQPEARDAGLRRLLVAGRSDVVRDRIVPVITRSRSADERVRRVAETFAWGVQRARELTGRLFTVELIAGDALGYTRLSQPTVFVNALPLLRGDRNGAAVVRGLIVHEIGHHMYHADAAGLRAAEQAREEHIFRLLNLVLDEHLERNLRALSADFGDALKRLASHAFQHTAREIPVATLFDVLRHRALVVLCDTRLGAAAKPGHVVVPTGRVLRELERHGHSFARFVRALRMGLGTRAADARMRAGLGLFGGAFRRAGAPALLEITRELRRIFGDETRLLDLLGDGDAPLEGEPGHPIRVGEGADNATIQREVERILGSSGSTAGSAGRPARLSINVSNDADFARITEVVTVPFDAARSADYRRRVRAPAARLRGLLISLGLAHEPVRQRLQGRLVDRGRLLALAVRGEPRVMVARRTVVRNDLFIGVAVDCSGSMRHDDNMEKARLFGELLAESVRGCRGIDMRICGFTDTTILDAGAAARCAAHNLEADGGNNDAAGLWHLACEALRSRRRAVLLVMISDGLPTECSVTALRNLVDTLGRRHRMTCAQVAVRPLEEECFPVHVRIDEDDLDAAVGRFGTVVARLVRRTLGAGC